MNLRFKPVYKVYYYYKNVDLWKNKSISKLNKKKWNFFKLNENYKKKYYCKGIYFYHYKKITIERLYSYKFVNKQILRKYLVNYKEFNFKHYLLTNFLNFEKRLDFNIYHANFVNSLYAAKFFIVKGYVYVNKKRITSINYLLKQNDLVEIKSTFWNYTNQRINFIDFQKKYYIRNLEVDYKTFSFIFLDKSIYYILNFNNFIKKKIYKKRHFFKYKNTYSYKKRIYNLRNKRYLNHYFKFFEYIYNYYLFLDKRNKVHNRKKDPTTSQNITLLFKFIKTKYTDYYFRNILLKRIFNYKYNYLFFLQTNHLFNNYYNFENINKSINTNLILNKSSINYCNTLNKDFFKYYFNVIFKIYISLLKYNYLNQLDFNLINKFSINYYNNNNDGIIILYSSIFKLLNIKNKLYYYYTINYNTKITDSIISNKFKHINYKLIKQINLKTKIKTYKTLYNYSNLMLYISSIKYKYRIYRKCHSFKQNNFKRKKTLIKIKKAFKYKYYNCARIGVDAKLLTKRFIFNMLINKVNKLNLNTFVLPSSISLMFLSRKSVYYPKSTDLYKYIYSSLITNLNNLKLNLNQILTILNSLKNETDANLTTNYNTLLLIEEQLKLKLDLLTNDHDINNFNYNDNFRDIYLLYKLINNFKNTNKNINLMHNSYNLLYKLHFKTIFFNQKEKNKFANKRYKRLISYNQRFDFNYFYINYSKTKLFLASNIKKYFLIFNYNTKANKYFKKFQKKTLYQNKYFYKNFKNKEKINKSTHIYTPKNIFYYLNMNIIDNNFNFKNNLFYIDLILNLYIRKLNTNYNKFSYKFHKNILPNYIFKLNSNKKLFNKNYKNNQYFYYFYNFKYLNYKTNKKQIYYNSLRVKLTYYINHVIKLNNKIVYFYDKNNYNNFIQKKIYNIYFKHYNKKKFISQKRIFIKFNKKQYLNNLYKIYIYYTLNFKKYKLIQYIFTNYIFKEFDYFLTEILNTLTIKIYNINYIKQLYYNLLLTKLFNFNKLDNIFKNNYFYSKNLKIMINYFIIIKRFYK